MCVYGADIYSIACKGAPGSGSYKHSDSYRHTGREYQGEFSCRLKEAGFDGVKYRVTVKNNLSGEKVQNGCQEAVIFVQRKPMRQL